MRDFLEKAVVNYLFYKKQKSVDEAIKIYSDNKECFNKVHEVLGDEFIDKILKCIEGDC